MATKYHIALVEDNAVNRSDFKEKISSFNDVKLICICQSGEELIEKTKGTPIDKLPDVVFMDLKMDKLS